MLIMNTLLLDKVRKLPYTVAASLCSAVPHHQSLWWFRERQAAPLLRHRGEEQAAACGKTDKTECPSCAAEVRRLCTMTQGNHPTTARYPPSSALLWVQKGCAGRFQGFRNLPAAVLERKSDEHASVSISWSVLSWGVKYWLTHGRGVFA